MKYEYWFANVKGISNKRKLEIRNKVEKLEEVFYMEEEKLELCEITENERKMLVESIRVWNIEKEYEKVLEKEIQCIPISHTDYPDKLREISSPPYMLYVKGKLPDKQQKTVAIVGARNCSNYGACMAREYAEVLAKEGVQIVSGMARGIDSVSQRSALEAGGTSFGVLGCGVDLCYPREEILLYSELIQRGGVISELPINTGPLKQNFPARNRIISGLSDAILVMEAKERSGSLITADMALEQGKDVYALPGPTSSLLSRGCNMLIKQGADILLTPEELLADLGMARINAREKTELTKNLLETPEKLVYSCLDLYPQNLEELIRKTTMPVSELLGILVSLELKGIVKEISKNYYVKLK